MSRAKRSRASDPFRISPSRFSICFWEAANEISRRSDTINSPSLCVSSFVQSISLHLFLPFTLEGQSQKNLARLRARMSSPPLLIHPNVHGKRCLHYNHVSALSVAISFSSIPLLVSSSSSFVTHVAPYLLRTTFFFTFANLLTLSVIIQKRAYLVDLINQFYWVFYGRSSALRVFFFFFFFSSFFCFVHIPFHFSLLTIHFPSLSPFLSSRWLSSFIVLSVCASTFCVFQRL